MSTFYALIGLCIFGSTLAKMDGPGPCPEIKAMPNFDVSKYLGKWYPRSVLLIPNVQFIHKCQYTEYSLDSNGTVVDIYTSISRKTGFKQSIPRIWLVPDLAEPAKTIIRSFGGVKAKQYILETDYDSFSLIYNCVNVKEDHSIQSIVYTREQNPSESIMEKIGEVIEKYNLPKAGFRLTKQVDCVMKPDEDYKE